MQRKMSGWGHHDGWHDMLMVSVCTCATMGVTDRRSSPSCEAARAQVRHRRRFWRSTCTLLMSGEASRILRWMERENHMDITVRSLRASRYTREIGG